MIKFKQNFKIERYHIKLFFFSYILIFFLFFVLVFAIENKSFEKKELSLIQKIYHKYDKKLYKFFLLKNSEPNTLIMGTSSALVFDPAFFNEYDKDTINLAFPAAKISEYYDFIKYTVENKKNVREIIIELKHYSFTDIEFNSTQPITISDNKLKAYFNLINTKNYKFYLEILYYYFKSFITNINKNEKDYFFNMGIRNYDSFKKLPINQKPVEFPGKFDENEYKKLIQIKLLCEKNKINLILFFGPITNIQKKFKNNKFINKEKKLIKKLRNDFSVIYDFKYFEEDIQGNFYDHIHYDYDIAKMIIKKIYK